MALAEKAPTSRMSCAAGRISRPCSSRASGITAAASSTTPPNIINPVGCNGTATGFEPQGHLPNTHRSAIQRWSAFRTDNLGRQW
jgi:hypothetical protein